MNKKVTIWGRDFNLKIIFDVYKGEDILDTQNEALEAFVKASDKVLVTCEELKEYCINNNKREIGDSIDNIFKYVMPESIYVKRDEKEHRVALLCNYKFDEEHGIALFFKNEKLDHIGSQDDI